MKKSGLLSVLALLMLACPASALRYQYLLISLTPSGFSGAPGALGPWIAVWQSNTLVVPPACGSTDVTTLPGFAYLAAPAGYTLNQFLLNGPGGISCVSSYSSSWTGPGGVVATSNADFSTISYFPGAPGIYGALESIDVTEPPGSPGGSYVLSANSNLYITDTWAIQPPPLPAWLGSHIRMKIGPIPPGLVTPLAAVVGLNDLAGNPIVPTQTVSLTPDQVTFVDFDVNTISSGISAEFVPVVSTDNPFMPPPQVTVEVFDQILGFGRLLASTNGTAPAAPSLAPQGLAAGQFMRLAVTAGSPNPCQATLSFVSSSTGTPVGPSLSVNLSPGQSQPLDLDSKALHLKLGQRTEVQPMVQIAAAAPSGAPITSVCSVSSAVLDVATQYVWTYQTAFAQ